jgi:RNA polymerase sigma-70 factor, ECF subfamily
MNELEPTPKVQLEAELVAQILKDDPQAFAELVKQFHRRVYSITYRMLGNVAEAEDLCQEIFLRVYQNLSSYDPNLPLAPWICRIASNTTINHLKRRTLKTVPLEINFNNEEKERPLVDERATPEQALLESNRNKKLQAAILSLPENYRLAFTLKYVENLTSEEIGEIMNIPRNTIKTWLVRAREALRGKLIDEL